MLSSPLHSIVLYLREGRSGLPCPESGETELDESCQWVSSRVLKDEVELYYEISLRVEVSAYNSSWKKNASHLLFQSDESPDDPIVDEVCSETLRGKGVYYPDDPGDTFGLFRKYPDSETTRGQ